MYGDFFFLFADGFGRGQFAFGNADKLALFVFFGVAHGVIRQVEHFKFSVKLALFEVLNGDGGNVKFVHFALGHAARGVDDVLLFV